MKRTNSYSKEMQATIKIFSLIGLIILVISNINRVNIYSFKQLIAVKYEFITFLVNCISIVLFLFVIIYPLKLGILSSISLLYGIMILVFEPMNNIGILMYGLSIMILYARGMFNKRKKVKEIIAFAFFVALILSELRFGKEIFFSCLLVKVAYSFTFFLCLFFFQAYTFDMFEAVTSNKKLDIKKFPELKKRDAEWLVEILNGIKYEYLAINYQMSLGSVKNRVKIIFDVIGVGDKQGFFNKYSDYEISYGDEFSSANKEKLFDV